MKKKMLFFVTILCLFLISNNVKAEEKFYEGEYIDGIYTRSVYVKNLSTHFQKARFFRRVSDNKEAYCIEPFAFFDENAGYESSINPESISSDKWKRMSLIVHYGYGYKNHTDSKWYAITQLLIWRESTSSGAFYFTDTLNGNKVDIFQDEINEIYNLVNEHEKIPSIAGKTFNLKKGENYIYDENDSLKYFKNVDGVLNIDGNKLNISNLEEGSYTFTFERDNGYNDDPAIFYYSPNSQNIMTSGYIDKDKFNITINIFDTEVNINKIDQDTGTNRSSGNGRLCEAKFNLYDSDSNLITELELDENCNVKVKNLDLGKYYIKETKAGEGYLIDDNTYEIDLTLDNTKINLQLSNKIIEKDIVLHKEYGTNTDKSDEKDVIFDIYSGENYIDTIVTNDIGVAEVKLPYGEYEFRQVTSKEGYKHVDNFNIKVEDDKPETFELLDYKINVPDTRDNSSTTSILQFILFILMVLYVKR